MSAYFQLWLGARWPCQKLCALGMDPSLLAVFKSALKVSLESYLFIYFFIFIVLSLQVRFLLWPAPTYSFTSIWVTSLVQNSCFADFTTVSQRSWLRTCVCLLCMSVCLCLHHFHSDMYFSGRQRNYVKHFFTVFVYICWSHMTVWNQECWYCFFPKLPIHLSQWPQIHWQHITILIWLSPVC